MWLTDLPAILRGAGLDVIEVPGWRTRGHGPMDAVTTITVHHTGGPPTGDYPSLPTVRDGRPDLPGPLAQLGVGRSGVWLVVAAGLAYHAGPSLMRDFENARALGIEAEGTGTAGWPLQQWRSLVAGVAALGRAYDVPVHRVLGHKETCRPVGRKVDPNFDMAQFRRDVTDQEDPMPTAAEIAAAVLAAPTSKGTVRELLEEVHAVVHSDLRLSERSLEAVRALTSVVNTR